MVLSRECFVVNSLLPDKITGCGIFTFRDVACKQCMKFGYTAVKDKNYTVPAFNLQNGSCSFRLS